MRTRWHVPDDFQAFLCTLGFLYFVGTLLGGLFALPIKGGVGFDHAQLVGTLLLCLFAAPFALGGALAFALCLVPHLWENRPRRVTEPVTENLREGWDA